MSQKPTRTQYRYVTSDSLLLSHCCCRNSSRLVIAGEHGVEGSGCHCSPTGITRERLESFDRPIKVEPEDYPDKRDALIGEFQKYLGILKVRDCCSRGR